MRKSYILQQTEERNHVFPVAFFRSIGQLSCW